MKPQKLEFVVFNISQENAVFVWNIVVKSLQFLGFDVTGNVEEYEDLETVNEELSEAENFEDYGVWPDFDDDVDWNDPESYYSTEDEHDD